MQFIANKMMEPLSAFLQACPLLQAGTVILSGDYSPEQMVDDNVLVYTGATEPLAVQKDVQGNAYFQKQSNFNLFFRTTAPDAALDLSSGDFLYHFETWLDAQNYLSDPPRLGSPGTDQRIWADHGVIWRDSLEAEKWGYWLQLHIEYQQIYQTENESED